MALKQRSGPQVASILQVGDDVGVEVVGANVVGDDVGFDVVGDDVGDEVGAFVLH